MALAIDGTPVRNTVTSGTTCAVSLTTTQTNDIICVLTHADSAAVGVSGSTLGAFTQIATTGSIPDQLILWAAFAPGALSSETITATYGGGLSRLVVDAFGVSGSNQISLTGAFDAGGPIGGSYPVSITTVNPKTMVVAYCELIFGVNDTGGAGFTLINGTNPVLAEYQVLSSTATVSGTNSNGFGGTELIFAIVQAAAAPTSGLGGSAPLFAPKLGPKLKKFKPRLAFTSSVSLSLSGAEGSFVISGQAATTAAARKMAGVEGSFSISGQAAAMSHGYKLAGAEGSFTIAGQAATELRGIKLGGAEGAFVINGQAATLTLTTSGHFTLAGDEGVFTIGGQAASLSASRKVAGAEGSFSISGQAAGMLRGIKVSGAEGAFSIGGQVATELRGIKLAGAEGAFVIGGQAATLSHGTKLAGAEGAFVIAGQASTFAVGLSLKGIEGAFTINGPGATLTYTPSGGGGATNPHSNPFMATPGPMTSLP